MKRLQMSDSINKLSPTELFEDTAQAILGVTSEFGRFTGQFDRTMPLGEALMANWANIAVMAVGLVICFAASYMLFLRIEIRPGD